MRQLRLKNRRGAFAVMTAAGFVVFVSVAAIAIDFSRLWTLRNELQTSADAGALAGAIALFPSRYTNQADVIDTATAYATRNTTMSQTPAVDSVVLGDWDQATQTFTPGPPPQNAIQMVMGYDMSGLIMSAFGVAPPRIRARAVGWAAAPVATSGCIKPWALPYESLMHAINQVNGVPDDNASLNRPFNQASDVAAINAMNAGQRTFSLQLESGGGTLPAGGYSGGSLPQFYQTIGMGKVFDVTGAPLPTFSTGATSYQNFLDGTTCEPLSVGDSVGVDGSGTGTLAPATAPALVPNVCATISANVCFDALGNVGSAPIKAAFFNCGGGCAGSSTLGVRMLGSFVITKVYGAAPPPGHQEGEIEAEFRTAQASGPAGGTSTTLLKPVLVR